MNDRRCACNCLFNFETPSCQDIWASTKSLITRCFRRKQELVTFDDIEKGDENFTIDGQIAMSINTNQGFLINKFEQTEFDQIEVAGNE